MDEIGLFLSGELNLQRDDALRNSHQPGLTESTMIHTRILGS
ncbi:hypothetical protein [Dyella mobilis]|nr:hypothetical protein [Dyella mobilis]